MKCWLVKSLPITRCWASLCSAADKSIEKEAPNVERALRVTPEGGNLISRSLTAVGMSQIDTAERIDRTHPRPRSIQCSDLCSAHQTIYMTTNVKGVRHTMRVSTSGRKERPPTDRILLRRKEQSKWDCWQGRLDESYICQQQHI